MENAKNLLSKLLSDTKGGMPEMSPEIKEMIGKFMSNANMGQASDVDIMAHLENFNLDQYKDENGVVRCPVPQEERDQLKASFKGL